MRLTTEQLRHRLRAIAQVLPDMIATRETLTRKLLVQIDERPMRFVPEPRSILLLAKAYNEEEIQQTVAEQTAYQLELEARTTPPPEPRALSDEARAAIADLGGHGPSSRSQRLLDSIAAHARAAQVHPFAA